MEINDNLIKQINKDTSISIINNISDEWKELVNAASAFLSLFTTTTTIEEQTEELDKQIEQQRKKMEYLLNSTSKQIDDDEVRKIIEEYKKYCNESNRDIKQLYPQKIKTLKAIFDFQKKVYDFLGVSVQLLYINPVDGQEYVFNEEQELFMLLTKTNQITSKLRYNIGNLNTYIQQDNNKSIKNLQSYIEEQLTKEEDIKSFKAHFENVSRLKNTILSHNINKNQVLSNEIVPGIYNNTSKKENLFLVWEDSKDRQNTYIFGRFKNYGTFNEGYAGALVSFKEHSDKFKKNINQNQQAEFLFKNYISQADNIPGAFQGDIEALGLTTNQNKKLQFAVKAGKFSTQRYGILINIAHLILQYKDSGISKDKFIETFKQENHQNYSKLVKVIDESIKTEIESTFKNINFSIEFAV